MSDERHSGNRTRWTDKVLPILAILGPLAGFFFGTAKAGARYQVIIDDHETVKSLVSWKDRQEDFNKVIIQQIATLQGMNRRR